MPEKTISVGRMRVNGVIDPSLVTITVAEDGTEFLNFPVKALREQILECMNCLPGGEFVSAAEIKKALSGWNGQPITIDHPVNEHGDLEFANRDAAFRESVEVGTIDNARFKDGFLWVDAHLDRMKAAVSVEGRGILAALLGAGQDIEVSTGYGMLLDFVMGTFEGQRYQFAQSEIEPDHLALLPIGTTGACSVKDGCGAARAAQQLVAATAGHTIIADGLLGGDDADRNKLKDFVLSAMRLLGIRAAKGGAGDPLETPPDPSGADNGGGGGSPSSEGKSMDRAALIAALVAAVSVPFVKEDLDGFDDARLNSLATLAGIDCGGCGDAAATAAAEAEAAAVAAAAAAAAAANSGDDGAGDGGGDGAGDGDGDGAGSGDAGLTAEDIAQLKEFIAGIPAVSALVSAAKATVDQERAGLITALVANERCAVPEATLKDASLDMLRSLSSSFLIVDYSGLGGAPVHALGANESGNLEMPPIITASNSDA